MRVGLRATLEDGAHVEVVGEAANADQAYDLSRDRAPAVLLMSLSVPGPPVVQIAPRLRSSSPAVRVLALADAEAVDVRALVAAGVAGCMRKTEAPVRAVEAVRMIARGMTWFHQSMVSSLTRRPASDDRCAGVDSVTERELDVLRLVAQGQTSARIGTELGISERTVRFHLENLFDRLGVHNRTGAVATATRLGLISMDGPAPGAD